MEEKNKKGDFGWDAWQEEMFRTAGITLRQMPSDKEEQEKMLDAAAEAILKRVNEWKENIPSEDRFSKSHDLQGRYIGSKNNGPS